MRKFILSICVFVTSMSTFAQSITANSGKMYDTFPGVDYVFFFNGIKSDTEITYNGTGTVEWTSFTNGKLGNSTSGVTSFSPEGDTGYILKIDGQVSKKIWVIDYSKYLPILKSVSVPAAQTNECKTVSLAIDADIPALSYQTPTSATSIPITRDFNIAYTTLSWSGTAWTPKDTTITIYSPIATLKSVPAPYCSTKFTLSGDQYAEGLNLTKASVSSIPIYTPVAVICHETSVVQTRDAKNENERPTKAKDVTGSAPLDMIFYSNPNDPMIVKNYNWEIFKDKSKNSIIGGRTDPTTPYTFTEAGSYVVKVTVSNDKACSFSDSITVTVSTSSIVAPNVFTPNGDGFNDEFRVAYKSITSFHCWIYNRWGRLVYEWTDPMKGWDGNIGGRKAAPGAYFYIIKALGSDYDPNSKPDPKTKLRVGEYKLKGDINLLRGADN